ncbi:Dehydrogenase (flavoprotein) [Chitinophaga rupis]|uniref:Dehydrogenase (Flavoprotein) n=1 Tax=Chitinophaga rupis TaxID=573321 RepID=A0A1H7UYG5_9BACT|nr:tryptophan 7-halogenase [Chitinophaga rupis]SEM02021.1 Dehydrogenase (flavoprotein) [Chitinophaga rupis]
MVLQTFDVLILGGGPAGTCAALRLLSLGYRVALVERESFPRPQIGESLSPGIRNIFEYLHASHLLTRHNYLQQLPAKVIWETSTAQTISPQQRGPGIMVDRGLLDKDLLELAVDRGLHLFQPASLHGHGIMKDGKWWAHIRMDKAFHVLMATFLLDARGRDGTDHAHRITTAPPTLALWAYTPAQQMPNETLIEARDDGWTWGSPMPDQRFRIISFMNPVKIRPGAIADVFGQTLDKTQLFRSVIQNWQPRDIAACVVSNYVHAVPWDERYIRLGEAAFSLDPLSSSGVEKAMRFSLQAVIAVNTILQSGDEQLARWLYERKLIDAVVTHTRWTADYYARAWTNDHPFWKERATPFISDKNIHTNFHQTLYSSFTQTPVQKATSRKHGSYEEEDICRLWDEPVQLSPALTYQDWPCIVDDIVQIKKGIFHPNLEEGIAYLADVEISPLLINIPGNATLGGIIDEWSKITTYKGAASMALFLWEKDILIQRQC